MNEELMGDFIVFKSHQIDNFIYVNYSKYFIIAYIVYLFTYISFLYFDYTLFPEHFNFFLINRIFLVSPFFIIALIINKNSIYKKHFVLINSIALTVPAIVGINLFLYVAHVNIVMSTFYFAGIVIQIFVMGLMIVRIKATVISTSIVIILYSIIMMFYHNELLNTDAIYRSIALLFTAGLSATILTFFYNTINNKLLETQTKLTDTLIEEKNKYLKIDKLNQDLNQSKLELQLLLNYIKTPAILTDLDGYILELNDERAKLFGYKRDEIINRHLSELLNDEQVSFRLNAFEDIIKSKSSYKYERAEGDTIYEITINPIYDSDGNIIKFATLYYDITDRKKLEATLKESNSTKDKFFSIIAHDLKNPIGSFHKLTEYFHDDYNNLNNDEIMEIVQNLKLSSKQVYKLLENLLDWSRAQQSRINFNPVELELTYLINNVVSSMSSQILEKKITINNLVQNNIQATVDANHLATVIRNILSNAIKFSYSDSEINIGLKDSEEEMIIYIQDFGTGMNDITKSKLFKLEKNSSNVGTNNETGTGLGLILCHEFIKLHNGKI